MLWLPGAGHGAGALQSFLLAFSALFSIINPPSSALIFAEVTRERLHAERTQLAGRIGLYAALVMLVSLSIGGYVLAFFGVSLAALRIAGGLVVAVRAWDLLQDPANQEERKQEQAGQSVGLDEVAFFPLTLPFTTGPGTISVAIALGANRPPGGPEQVAFFAGASGAALVMAVMIWIAYASADRLVAWLGRARARVLGRLAAFLLLCVGTQITLNGIVDALRPLLAGQG